MRIRQREQQQQDGLLSVNNVSVLRTRDHEDSDDTTGMTDDMLDYTQLQCFQESFGFFTDILNET
jgi:hypothetical protein